MKRPSGQQDVKV